MMSECYFTIAKSCRRNLQRQWKEKQEASMLSQISRDSDYFSQMQEFSISDVLPVKYEELLFLEF